MPLARLRERSVPQLSPEWVRHLCLASITDISTTGLPTRGTPSGATSLLTDRANRSDLRQCLSLSLLSFTFPSFSLVSLSFFSLASVFRVVEVVAVVVVVEVGVVGVVVSVAVSAAFASVVLTVIFPGVADAATGGSYLFSAHVPMPPFSVLTIPFH